jgi:cardiolipin synthase
MLSISVIVIVLYSLLILWAIITLFLYGSRPSKSFSWLLVLIFIPFLGFIFYIVFGLNRRKFSLFTLKETKKRRHYTFDSVNQYLPTPYLIFKTSKEQALANLVINNSGLYPYPNNELVVLDDGISTFKAIFEAMEVATSYIHMQYYIFEEGQLLERLYQLFKLKIKQGVEIHIIYDAIGSFNWRKKSIDRFKNIGVQVFPLMPLRFGRLLFTLNYRNHRKIIIVDGEIGFTGGVNLSDKYIKASTELGIWDDMHLAIKGPAVASLHQIFIKDYYFASKQNFRFQPNYPPYQKVNGDSIIQLVASGPDTEHASIMQQYIKLINLADRYIYIANPYFIPNTALLEAIKIASLSGVTVKLLIPEKLDSRMVKYSMQSYFEELLQANIKIYLNHEKFLHSKVIIVDDEISSIGSGNFDNRSFEQNFEVNAIVYDKKIAKLLYQDFEKDCSRSNLLEQNNFRTRPFKHKLIEGIARLFSSLM